MPLQATSGAASYDAFGGGVAAVPTYIESCFSTFLYTGNGSTQTITNGIDLAGKGGLVWTKLRSIAFNHSLWDTNRGTVNRLVTNSTAAQENVSPAFTSFNSNGFSVGADAIANYDTYPFVSWTFRKQPKFFDVVTYTGNGSNRTISHSLGSVPGCIMVKRTDTTGAWAVYHRSLANTEYLVLNTTAAKATGATYWNSTTATSTDFSLGTATDVNANTGTYVAYLFAHDAGGFGLTGTDNVISCGSYTGNGSLTGPTVTLGYEPQWVLIKKSSAAGTRWTLTDNMRGFPVSSSGQQILQPNTTDADIGVMYIQPTSTGFKVVDTDTDVNQNGATYIYIAIRRGPMKTPTTGTSVFAPYVTSSSGGVYNAGFVTDWLLQRNASGTDGWYTGPRLNGGSNGGYYMKTETTSAEVFSSAARWDSNIGAWNFNGSYGCYMFQRAPGFFDVVCYTGTGANRTVTHNLGVAPELMIIKSRSSGYGWPVYAAAPGPTKFAYLDDTGNFSANSTAWNDTAPTASVFTVGTGSLMNTNGVTYVAYLFATVSGVSKVGSYTGTGTTLQIDCGFTGGARFVLIKRTDDTGGWYVWDSARGIVAGNDPYLLLNSATAEVTNTDYVDTYSAGFEISSTAPAAINANGGSFIFLAIA